MNREIINEEKILSDIEIKNITESVLFAAGYPVSFAKLAAIMKIDEEKVKNIAMQMKEEYSTAHGGLEFLILEDNCQIVTRKENASYIRAALGIREGGNLSRASLETLAIVAYNQPVTRAYIEQVRGVDSTYSVTNLLERGLIEVKGNLDVAGHPRLYGTTPAFLRVFGMQSLEELPAVEVISQSNDEEIVI